eukprot:jgi/Chrzof1/4392/Cz14g11130.t1_SLAC1
MICEYIISPQSLRALLRHPNQSLFLGAIPMSVNVITNGLCTFWLPRYGPGVATAAIVLYWINVPAVVACFALVPLYIFPLRGHKLAMEQMTAVWLLPVVPACVAANTAGIIASQLPGVDLEIISCVLYSGGYPHMD